eukprot:g30545.t1
MIYRAVSADSSDGFPASEVLSAFILTKLIELFEEVTKKIDDSRAVNIVYMDFSKAFDKVPHSRLRKGAEMAVRAVECSSCLMWEIRERSSVADDYVCRKCDRLQLLTDHVVRKSTFDMLELFRDLLMRVQDQHIPVRRKDKDGK